MKHLTQPIDFCKVQDFVTNFENEYPHLYLLIDLDEVAGWLAQPHWSMYSDNLAKGIITKAVYDRFMFGMFADWLLAQQLCEVSC